MFGVWDGFFFLLLVLSKNSLYFSLNLLSECWARLPIFSSFFSYSFVFSILTADEYSVSDIWMQTKRKEKRHFTYQIGFGFFSLFFFFVFHCLNVSMHTFIDSWAIVCIYCSGFPRIIHRTIQMEPDGIENFKSN